ncbi:hypothetical protein FB446DRAFT_723062 [Lentinula raphanica]|nr:hypothetical protein FB446DRAFT_723062 [Lentinula raphanica]
MDQIGKKPRYEYSRLPQETTKLFARDSITDTLLWFPSPPKNLSGFATSPAESKGPQYSLEYLHWRATQARAKIPSQRNVGGNQ